MTKVGLIDMILDLSNRFRIKKLTFITNEHVSDNVLVNLTKLNEDELSQHKDGILKFLRGCAMATIRDNLVVNIDNLITEIGSSEVAAEDCILSLIYHEMVHIDQYSHGKKLRESQAYKGSYRKCLKRGVNNYINCTSAAVYYELIGRPITSALWKRRAKKELEKRGGIHASI